MNPQRTMLISYFVSLVFGNRALTVGLTKLLQNIFGVLVGSLFRASVASRASLAWFWIGS